MSFTYSISSRSGTYIVCDLYVMEQVNEIYVVFSSLLIYYDHDIHLLFITNLVYQCNVLDLFTIKYVNNMCCFYMCILDHVNDTHVVLRSRCFKSKYDKTKSYAYTEWYMSSDVYGLMI